MKISLTRLHKTSIYENFGANSYVYLLKKPNRLKKISEKFLSEILESIDNLEDYELWGFGFNLEDGARFDFQEITKDAICSEERNGGAAYIGVDSWADVSYFRPRTENKKILVIIDVNYLSNLYDPRPFLLALKNAMFDRNIHCKFFKENSGYSLRQWSKDGLEEFLISSGFLLKSNDLNSLSFDFILDASLSKEHYREYLRNANLNPDCLDCEFIIVTTEDSSVRRSGGIGTYVSNVKRLNPKCAVLFVDINTENITHSSRTLIAEKLLGGSVSFGQMIDGDGVLEALKVALFALPNVSICEFQDWVSIGFRLVQARQTGGLPLKLSLRVFLHGNIDYVKYGHKSKESATYSIDEIRSIIKDRYIFENVDEVVVPSNYLFQLMTEEFGYKLHNPRLQKLPFDLDLIKSKKCVVRFERPRQIVFIGKFLKLKGWPDFVNSIRILSENDQFKFIEKIVIISPGQIPAEDYAFLNSICPAYHFHFDHMEVLDFLEKNRSFSLFVVPSGAENYPYVFRELALMGCRFIGYKSGGAVETIENAEILDSYFCRPDYLSLASCIAKIINFSYEIDHTPLIKNQEITWIHQESTNEEFKKTSFITRTPSQLLSHLYLEEITVVTPVYNTNFSYLDELADSLRSSSIKPIEWIVVNDGSDQDYAERLNYFAQLNAELNIRILAQKNSGLASARNLGLQHVKTKYAFFIDSDDILLPHSLSHLIIALGLQPPDTLAIGGFSVYFESLEGLPKDTTLFRNGVYWKPLGTEHARTLSISQNEFFTSTCLINVEIARGIGGWDDSDSSTWEDWSFFLRASWLGNRLAFIPMPLSFYRSSPKSMSKTYNQYYGVRRLTRQLPFVDKFESNCLISLAQGVEKMSESNMDEIHELKMQIHAILTSNSWKISAPIRKLSGLIRGASSILSR